MTNISVDFSEFLVLILFFIIAIYLLLIGFKYPLAIAIIYPFTFLDVIQSKLSFFGFTPAFFVGGLLIIIGILKIKSNLGKRLKHNYSMLFLLILFAGWLFIRFLIEGSEIRIVITFLANIFAIISLLVIIRTAHDYEILNTSFGFILNMLALSMILAYYFPQNFSFLGLYMNESLIRSMGLSRDPNYGGTIVAVGVLYNLIYFLYSRKHKNKCIAGLLFGFLIISTISLTLTLSRAAILSLLISLLFLFLFGRINFGKFFLSFSAIALIIYLNRSNSLISNVISRFLVLSYDDSNYVRIQIFKSGINIIKENILFGNGKYLGFHNTYLDITSSGGIISLLIFTAIIVIVIRNNYLFLSTKSPFIKSNVQFIIGSLVVLLGSGFFIGMEFEKILWFIIGLGLINSQLALKN